MEQKLLSGDIVDVLFSDGRSFVAVEVKSIISSDDDFQRGVYQCVKYRAVLKAQQAPIDADVRVVLVTERDLPKKSEARKNILEINHFKVSINRTND